MFKVKEAGVTKETYHHFERYNAYAHCVAIVMHEDSTEVWTLDPKNLTLAALELQRYYLNQFDAAPRITIYRKDS